jgi:hypothetical protein
MSGVTQVMADIRRSEDMFKAAAGIEANMKSVLGPTSISAAAQAVADLHRNQAATRAALGIEDNSKATLGGHASVNAALEAMVGVRSLEEAARGLVGTVRPELSALGSMGAPEVLPAPRLAISAYRVPTLPPNPIHKTNEIVGKILAHQQAEAGKKDADRSEAKIESAENKVITRSGLLHTKASVWVALIAFVVPMAWGVWVYFDAKADALENEKKTEMQLEKLRAEIRALKASKPVPETPAKPDGAPPSGKAALVKSDRH